MVSQVLQPEDVAYWAESKDYFLRDLADGFVGGPPPEEQNLIDILTFLAVFSIGYKEMAMDDLCDLFDKRINAFIVGLQRMGFTKDFRKEYVAKRTIPGPLERIIRVAFGRAAYRMFDQVREVEKPQGGK